VEKFLREWALNYFSQGYFMIKKSVPDLIYDKFAELVGEDSLFSGIFDDLLKQVRAKKKSEKEITNLLSKGKDEDSRT
jgi:hypothetical protein